MTQTAETRTNSHTARILGILPIKVYDLFMREMGSLANVLVKLHVSPNVVSLLGLLAGMGAGLLFAINLHVWAAVLIIISGISDIVDGKVAAQANKKSLYGAIFDSTVDRYSEFFIYLGLAVYFRNRWPLWILFFTFLGSTMVSYTRARAEGLGIECKVGFMQRAERMLLLILGTLIGSIFKVFDPVMIVVLTAIALISNFTAFERTLYVRKIEIRKEKEEGGLKT
jgi:CDP-diacylglycerol---glycerol-3-phosphate 3-phosphatidyltransferase